jgi:hypothetical protein
MCSMLIWPLLSRAAVTICVPQVAVKRNGMTTSLVLLGGVLVSLWPYLACCSSNRPASVGQWSWLADGGYGTDSQGGIFLHSAMRVAQTTWHTVYRFFSF